MRRTIVSSQFIPDELLAEHYGLSRTTVAKIRSSHNESLEVSS
jgi:biotin operon repressor